MQFDFDSNKDRLNLEKYGLSLGLAAKLDWEAALVWIDDRQDYGETRVLALDRAQASFTTSLSLTEPT